MLSEDGNIRTRIDVGRKVLCIRIHDRKFALLLELLHNTASRFVLADFKLVGDILHEGSRRSSTLQKGLLCLLRQELGNAILTDKIADCLLAEHKEWMLI